VSLDPHTFRWERWRDESDGVLTIQVGLLWAGTASYPGRYHRTSLAEQAPSTFMDEHPHLRMETRQCWVHFENRWQLSVIWGDATYSSNTMMAMWHGGDRETFIEEPTLVEVGVMMPGRDGAGLVGEPLGYVSVPEFHRVAELVMHLPTDCVLPEGEWDDAQGFCDFLVTAGMGKTL